MASMTEKEKMLSQRLYNANDERYLAGDRDRARELCYDFNMLRPAAYEAQRAIMQELLGKTSGEFIIVAPFYCDYGFNIEIGENFFCNHNTVILDCAPVRIGNNVMLGPNCCINAVGHPIDVERRNQGLEFAYPVTIGDNVWLGAGVQVLPGVTIGNNVVIGAGSVVVRDIPDNVVAVGSPCRVMRAITAADREKCWDRT